MKDGIRNKYAELGVDKYYSKHGSEYENPHYIYIEPLVKNNADFIPTKSKILDLGAGGGEVTRILSSIGSFDFEGCDPYTYQLYEEKTGITCLPYSFKDIVKGKLDDRSYDWIIASFSYHLCPPELLYSLTFKLFSIAPRIAIITPHKRPVLEQLDGVELLHTDYVFTARGKKVNWKIYGSNY